MKTKPVPACDCGAWPHKRECMRLVTLADRKIVRQRECKVRPARRDEAKHDKA